MSDPQALHVTRNVIPGKLGVDLHLHRVHIPLVYHYNHTQVYLESGSGGGPGHQRPWRPPLTNPNLFRNRNVEPSSYPYTSTKWFSDIATLISGYHQIVVPNGTRRTDT